jgi:hypothetical protein
VGPGAVGRRPLSTAGEISRHLFPYTDADAQCAASDFFGRRNKTGAFPDYHAREVCVIRIAGLFLLAAAAAMAQPPYDLDRVSVGTEAPDFELPQPAGDPVRLSSLRGNNVVLVFYRGYW